MVFYAAFNSISVISQGQLTLFMSFLGFTSARLGLWSVLPKDTPMKKLRGSSAARTQDPSIASQALYHLATQDPCCKWKLLQLIYQNGTFDYIQFLPTSIDLLPFLF